MGAGMIWRKGRVGLLLAALGAGGVCGCASPFVQTTWAPDNARLAYGSEDGKLNVYDVTTQQVKEMTIGGSAGSPSWSPNGKYVAFYAEADNPVDLKVVDMASGQVRTIARDLWQGSGRPTPSKSTDEKPEPGLGTFVFTQGISWSPDSMRLVCPNSAPTAGGLLVVDVASGEATKLLQGKHTILSVSWSPDGRYLACLQAPVPPAELEAESDLAKGVAPDLSCTLSLYELSTGATSTLCSYPVAEWAIGVPLQWSADSQQIGFVKDDPGYSGRAVGCLISAQAGAPLRQVVRGITEEAAWAPDLHGLAFLEGRADDKSALIYKGVAPPVRLALGEVSTMLAHEGGAVAASYSLPNFSHDGREVAVLAQIDSSPGSANMKPLIFKAPKP